MSGLEKATLTRLSNDANDTEEGEPIPVQFNPSSLKLTLSNNTEGGASRGRPQRQFSGNASTELAFDLVFDTADEDDGSGGPRSVREKTALVEQFVLSQGTGPGRKAPPRVKFHWDRLIVKGVITSVAVDFDLFASNGTPLRAKVGISIKEQDAKYEIGTSTEGGAPAPGEAGGAGPGSAGGGSGDRSATALAGESAADFAARMGLDPSAWRGLAAGLDGTLSLSAGLEIDFNASLNVSAGIGVSVGFEADVGASLEASLGLKASASSSAGASAGASAASSAGFALSAAGGVGAAVETVKIAKAEAAAGESIQSFGASGASPSAAVATGGASAALSGAAAPIAAAATGATTAGGAGAAARGASRSGGAAPASSRSAPASSRSVAFSSAPVAYAPPRVDPRAAAYGFGVPLRPSVSGAAATTQGVVAIRPYARASDVPVTRDPTVPAWVRLPTASAPSTSSTATTGKPPHTHGDGRTGCGCGCGPGGAKR